MKIFCKIFFLLTVLYFSFKNWICTSLFCPGAPRNQLFILSFLPFMMINLTLFPVYFLTDPALVFECWTNFADEWGRLTCIFQMKSRYLCNLCRDTKEYKRLWLCSPYREILFFLNSTIIKTNCNIQRNKGLLFCI